MNTRISSSPTPRDADQISDSLVVIVVNYCSAELAVAAVESALAESAGSRSVEVHLVDNASPGDDAERLRVAAGRPGWERVKLWLEAENHGFGRGNNRVLEALARRPTPPDKVFLLNPDARLEGRALATLADLLDARPEIAAAGCRIRKPCGTPVTSSFRFPSLIGEFCETVNFGPLSRLFAHRLTPLPPDQPTGSVDWTAGAAVMFRFASLVQVGFFDPAYFLYYEEVDLMRRLRRAGWSIWHVAEAEAVHVEGASTGVRSGEDRPARRPAYWHHSWRVYFVKNHGRAYALACAAARLSGALLSRAISALRRRAPSVPPHYIGDFWRHACRPMLIGSDAAVA